MIIKGIFLQIVDISPPYIMYTSLIRLLLATKALSVNALSLTGQREYE